MHKIDAHHLTTQVILQEGAGAILFSTVHSGVDSLAVLLVCASHVPGIRAAGADKNSDPLFTKVSLLRGYLKTLYLLYCTRPYIYLLKGLATVHIGLIKQEGRSASHLLA